MLTNLPIVKKKKSSNRVLAEICLFLFPVFLLHSAYTGRTIWFFFFIFQFFIIAYGVWLGAYD